VTRSQWTQAKICIKQKIIYIEKDDKETSLKHKNELNKIKVKSGEIKN